LGDREDGRLDLTHLDPAPPTFGCVCAVPGFFCGTRTGEFELQPDGITKRPTAIYGADCKLLHRYQCLNTGAPALDRGRCPNDSCVHGNQGGDHCRVGFFRFNKQK